MTIEIKRNDKDPESGERRYLKAEKFAGKWRFSYRLQRRDVRWRDLQPTREMWEHVLDGLRRRYRRREGVEDDDVNEVERLLRQWKDAPAENDG
jgi:hypothetical protein